MTFTFHHVVRARYLGGHRVLLQFDDGLVGNVDFAPYLRGPIFQPLKNPAYFADFVVDRTLVWPNGADFAPEFLRERTEECPSSGDVDECACVGPWKEQRPDDPPLPHEICRFLDIVVCMGVPGVKASTLTIETEHARAKIDVETWAIDGTLPKYALECLEEWRGLHLEELRRNVARLERGETALPIEPLD